MIQLCVGTQVHILWPVWLVYPCWIDSPTLVTLDITYSCDKLSQAFHHNHTQKEPRRPGPKLGHAWVHVCDLASLPLPPISLLCWSTHCSSVKYLYGSVDNNQGWQVPTAMQTGDGKLTWNQWRRRLVKVSLLLVCVATILYLLCSAASRKDEVASIRAKFPQKVPVSLSLHSLDSASLQQVIRGGEREGGTSKGGGMSSLTYSVYIIFFREEQQSFKWPSPKWNPACYMYSWGYNPECRVCDICYSCM